MPIDRKRFIVSFLVTNVVLACVLTGMITAGVGAAIPTAGVGTFAVTFDELHGEGFEQESTMGGTETCGQYSVNVAQIDEGTIEGLHLFKDVEMPVTGETVRVSIQSDDVEFQGLSQKFTHLEGDLSFDEDQVTEYDTEGSQDQMRMSASSITIEDGTIHTDRQFITKLSLDDLTVDTIRNPDDEGLENRENDCIAENSTDE
ncbi:hypothetical protein HYG81_07505 [Natrinema zhouii]|uniref:Uncharacterized protein n=1 Tax=Natrinema zhouii TaxID=1710539 RepID=A0A7D6CQM8_9EURY|nr:DUF6230 family protein [Natrinema zhouii]QLK27435.1 hypothetical protein HYG81_07505 [Natrinema zhouii]